LIAIRRWRSLAASPVTRFARSRSYQVTRAIVSRKHERNKPPRCIGQQAALSSALVYATAEVTSRGTATASAFVTGEGSGASGGLPTQMGDILGIGGCIWRTAMNRVITEARLERDRNSLGGQYHKPADGSDTPIRSQLSDEGITQYCALQPLAC
jgi:hypothetical protein